MARKTGIKELDKIIFFIVAIIAIYYFLRKVSPDNQSAFPKLQIEKIQANKFGSIALIFIVWLGSLILLIIEFLKGIGNSLFIYPTVALFILFLALSYKLTAMNKKQIEELIK